MRAGYGDLSVLLPLPPLPALPSVFGAIEGIKRGSRGGVRDLERRQSGCQAHLPSGCPPAFAGHAAAHSTTNAFVCDSDNSGCVAVPPAAGLRLARARPLQGQFRLQTR